MEFTIQQPDLSYALSTALASVPSKSTIPILSTVLLEAEGSTLRITGTDLDLTIQLTLAVGGEADGGVVLPARLAADIVRSMGAGKVEVSVEGDEVSITQPGQGAASSGHAAE